MPQPGVKKNLLSNLEVNEVSFVDRGAIGEKFSIIKMDDPENNDNTVIKEYNSKQIGESLTKMDDNAFMGVMSNMMTRYQEINKGGSEEMEREEIISLITETVTKSVTASMETINKNFVAVNKTIDEIKESKDTKVDPKATENEDVKEVKKAVDEMSTTMATVAKALETMSGAMNGMAEVTKSLQNSDINGKLDAVTKSLEAISSIENPANGLGEDITKNAGNDGKPVVFWKSFYNAPTAE